MTTSPAPETPRPVTVPTLQDRARVLEPLGWSGRAAEWIALVALHTGVFTRSQWCHFFDHANREAARVFVRALIDKQLAIEDERAIFPGGARAVLLTGKVLYRALGIPDVRHRRGKNATTPILMRRLLSLDYLIERPTLGWLPTEANKVRRFEALGIDRAVLPYRKYGEGEKGQPRYFALKLPIAIDERAATFVYVDAGQSTDSELRAWGVAHAPLWAALRARTFAVHVVAVGTGVDAAERAAPVLKHWTQNGDGQGAADPAGPTKADPNRASGEGRDGSDPPFCAAGAARRRGGVSHGVRHRVSPPPRLRGGRSRLYVSLQEGSPARTRAGRRAETSGAMFDRRIRAFLVVGGVSVACAWTWPGAFPAADPVAALVRYHTPNVYRAVVAWYDVAPGVAVFLAGQLLIGTSWIWFARMGVSVGLYFRGQRQEDVARDYVENYFSIDERVPRFRQLPSSRLVHATDLYTAEELQTSPTYNELMRRAVM